ncbi:MAG: MBL fold metallo-hydrolase, partial [Sedimentisphaerales bacterium]|nr:MBL fold metallo-hydrolase [Sedimentisphaerales bacterium]
MPATTKCVLVLVNNTTSRADLIAEHGLSLWIEYEGKQVLFDTGQSNAVINNAKQLGVELSRTDAVVISHGHYDHTGGLSAALDIAAKAKVYLHPSATELKFGRKDRVAEYIGMSEPAKKAIHGRHVIWTAEPAYLFPGVAVTGQVPRTNRFEDVGGAFFLDDNCQKSDNLLDDQTLFIESSKGLVVIFGCAHSGVVNILDYISKLTGCEKIYAVI